MSLASFLSVEEIGASDSPNSLKEVVLSVSAELGEVRGDAHGWVTWWVLGGVASSVLDKTLGV